MREEITPDSFVRSFSDMVDALGIEISSKSRFADYNINRAHHVFALRQVVELAGSGIRNKLERDVFDSDDKPTQYGEMLVFARFCLGWLYTYFESEKNQQLIRGYSKSHKNRMKAVYMAYAVYWHLGDDYLLGNVIENAFIDIVNFKLFKMRHEVKTRSRVHKDICSIADEIYHLFMEHYGPQYSLMMARLSFDEGPKPKRNFLPMFGMAEAG